MAICYLKRSVNPWAQSSHLGTNPVAATVWHDCARKDSTPSSNIQAGTQHAKFLWPDSTETGMVN